MYTVVNGTDIKVVERRVKELEGRGYRLVSPITKKGNKIYRNSNITDTYFAKLERVE